MQAALPGAVTGLFFFLSNPNFSHALQTPFVSAGCLPIPRLPTPLSWPQSPLIPPSHTEAHASRQRDCVRARSRPGACSRASFQTFPDAFAPNPGSLGPPAAMKTRPDGFQALNPDTAGVARGTVHDYTPISQGSSASGSKRRTLESLQRSRRLQAARNYWKWNSFGQTRQVAASNPYRDWTQRGPNGQKRPY